MEVLKKVDEPLHFTQ